MKTQSLASFVWNTWKGKPASTRGHFVPASRKYPTVAKTQTVAVAKKADVEAPKAKKASVKLSASDRRDLISSTQHLDACFSTMWRRAV